ncbi:hypothetical protein TNCV_2142311 [Trichonephila clavipes]|uniref:Uncharacterized protein n=1 Tax=Trichonephila clavipes TaxID=2585209 RepID=A0A8X6RTM6_TRICX|nr:hypothetical protein TNCV_2142311 [Trichonephila clavipes]
MEVTRFEQRSYIKIAVLRGKIAMEYHSELVEAVGNNVLSYRTVARDRRLWWTRHPHVHLAAAAQPLFDPREIEPRRPKDEREML